MAAPADTPGRRAAQGQAVRHTEPQLNPTALGSGAGSSGDADTFGGAGGGAIKLIVSGTLTVNGTLSADGADGVDGGYAAGGGSGGSIWITGGGIITETALSAPREETEMDR